MQTIVNLGTGGADLNGQNGSTTSADSNDALFLDWPGDNAGNYVYLPGVAGNNLSVPDEAALDITGDIDIRVQVAMDDWTPAVINDLCGKLTTSGDQRSWYFRLLTTGGLQLSWSTDGTFATLGAVNSTASVTAVDGDALWLRVTLDVDNGSSQHEVKFYTSDDGSLWTQLGSTQVVSGATSIFSSTSPFRLGARGDSAGIAPGKFYRAQILNGIDGTTVLDVDCSQITSGSATSFTALTGQTVTINRSTSDRKSVAVVSPVWLFGTDDFMQVLHNDLLSTRDGEAFTFVAILRIWNDTLSSRGVASKKAGGTTGDPGWVVQRDGTNDELRVVIDDADGDRTFGDTPTYVQGGLSVYATGIDTSTSTRRIYLNGSTSDVSASAIGDLSNSSNLEIGRRFGSNHWNFELIAASFYSRLLSVTELNSIRAYYQARLS